MNVTNLHLTFWLCFKKYLCFQVEICGKILVSTSTKVLGELWGFQQHKFLSNSDCFQMHLLCPRHWEFEAPEVLKIPIQAVKITFFFFKFRYYKLQQSKYLCTASLGSAKPKWNRWPAQVSKSDSDTQEPNSLRKSIPVNLPNVKWHFGKIALSITSEDLKTLCFLKCLFCSEQYPRLHLSVFLCSKDKWALG